nr:MAG TPA: hypothetical protein [Caudoviricetes sp.]
MYLKCLLCLLWYYIFTCSYGCVLCCKCLIYSVLCYICCIFYNMIIL